MSMSTFIGMVTVAMVGPGALMLFWLTIVDYCKVKRWKWKELLIDYALIPSIVFLMMIFSYYMLDVSENLCLQVQAIITFMYLVILDPYSVDKYRKMGEN